MKIKHQQPVPLRIKLFAWVNIGVQSAFPLTMAFTPAMAGGIDRHIVETTKKHPPKTRIYILSPGETSVSVAKKFHLTPEALRKLNQRRTFTYGFDNLQPGDKLNVPAIKLDDEPDVPAARLDNKANLPAARLDNKPDVPAIIWGQEGSAASALGDDAGARKMADVASRAGAFLSDNPNGDAALSLARGEVTAEASGQLQQWLNQFGTARVQLDADEHFSFKNSQFDLLAPLYEQKDSLIFTQGSLHRTDDRTQVNLGFGLRYFAPSYMLGGNIFGDYDLSRAHSRTGIGMEYWRDFLKLSANGYLRLSDWNNSSDFKDYQERPANGWDIRAQAWLPSLPQLGGKLTYEQYYGRGVALFGKENLQQDPRAITAGVNFTPFPLLTLNAEHRQGASGKNDKRLGVDFSYQLGMPWQQQINPQAVATMRSLAGSRYDLVERNNHILLQYRKKEVIRLHTVGRVTGYAGERKSLGVSVNSSYGLERIDWSASSLLAAGGKLVRENEGSWSVILPEHKPGEANSWTITGVAVDKKGNVSTGADTQVTVAQAAIDASMSPVTPEKITLPADGKTQQLLLLKINDRDGKPVDIAESEISVLREAKLRTAGSTTITAFSRSAAGEYVATLTAGTLPESFTLIPTARNVRFAPISVELTANDNTIVVKDAISATPTSAVAGDTVTYSAVLTDKQGNPQGAGIPVDWIANEGSTLGAQTSSSDETGTVAVTLTRAQPGTAKVSLILPSGKYSAPDVEFRAGVPDESRSELILTPAVIEAVKEPAMLTLILRDKNGNTLSGNTVRGVSDNSLVTISNGEEIANKPGNYGMTVTASKAGKAILSVTVNGKPFGQLKTLLTITGGTTTPELGFATAQHNVTWTKNFSDSQAVSGVPEGVEQQWSSSDNSVATVNEVGKVTLLKSGQTTITVKTSGNDQYDPAEASYQLKIDKADPQLQAGDGEPITAEWADGKVWSIASKFGNIDAENSLTATYTSENTGIVTVAGNGELQAVKPGSTRLTVSTPETDQFKPASVEVAYQLDKRTVDVSFKAAVIKTTDEEEFTLQLPENALPSDAIFTWESADKKVLDISSSGIVQGKVSKGKTRLTLSITANDYYSASSNYYDMWIYSKPSVSIGKVTYISKGVMADKGVWTPVFTDDKFSVTWSTESSDELSKAKFVAIYLKDSSGKALAQKLVDSPAGTVTTTFEPKPRFWNESLHVELVAQGFDKLTNSEKSPGINVKNLPPNKIWETFTVRSKALIRSDNGNESTCREIAGPAGKEHWIDAIVDGGQVNFNGKTLISPMTITGLTDGEQNGHYRNGQFPLTQRNIYSDLSVNFGTKQIARECWKGHDGSYFIGAKVNYNGENFEYWMVDPHNWTGKGVGTNKYYLDTVTKERNRAAINGS
ncbi:inverse autotransporter beta domain-containing protein [Erwinia tasmaniensis]|nr:inverse autotransporter beta domain-containing protein [Erwinia tasmaniensis]